MSTVVKKHVLVVEDHLPVAKEVVRLLHDEGFDATFAPTLSAAKLALVNNTFDLILLDIHLPDGLGFELCRAVRDRDAALPILFLTEKGDEDSVVRGLSFSATDYMRKPFARKELLVRLRRLLKEGPGKVVLGKLVLDPAGKAASWKNVPLALSPRELDILFALATNVGRLVTRTMLAERFGDADVSERSFNSYVSRLKSKLAEAGVTGVAIVAVYGEGYRLERK